jgi:NitT/TauT family transport system substrate-binding protein
VARARGLDVKVVAAAGSGGSGFVASEALAASFAANKDPASAFAAFAKSQGRKAKLATLPPGGVPTVALHHWLWKIGKVSKDDVEIVAMGIDAVQQAVLAGSVDGATVLEPSATIVLQRNPKLKMLLTARDMFPDIPGVVMAATGAFEKASPDALEKMVGLFARATELIRKNPAEAAKHVEAVLGGGLVDAATMEAALKSPAVDFIFDIRQIEAPTKALLAYQVEIGDFQTAPPTDGLFDPRWSDKILKR